jgi:hypothetical protein
VLHAENELPGIIATSVSCGTMTQKRVSTIATIVEYAGKVGDWGKTFSTARLVNLNAHTSIY